MPVSDISFGCNDNKEVTQCKEGESSSENNLVSTAD